MINLFDNFNQASQDLYASLQLSGFHQPTIVINDNGFLPDQVQSPYAFFSTGNHDLQGRPKSFYEIPISKFWEIRANGNAADIFDDGIKRGHMTYYTPLANHRIVSDVAWFDRQGKTRSIDHYDRFGRRFSETSCDDNGHWFATSYFSLAGAETIIENHQTGDIILNYQDKVYSFPSKTDFVLFYLKEAHYQLDRIFYNSLSTPMLLSYSLKTPGKDVLFWDEALGTEIPGNMQILLNDDQQRTKKIIFQNQADFEQMISSYQGKGIDKIHYLSFLFQYLRQNTGKANALIFTNSDQIEQLETLVKALPGMHFSIAALTEMSSKLMAFADFNNVDLYPNVPAPIIPKLWADNDFYLDINHGNEILSAVRQAFLHEQLILSFANTCHGAAYVSPDLVYDADNADVMVKELQLLAANPDKLRTALAQQKRHLSTSTSHDYRHMLN
ncbi:MAG: accessory Sec system glycosylation chaperone GtfB [Oenococcus sp.]|uniref:accessory Sec system glycosylation chaperone GtfB n=1 Tax=Oenococcus sp. TaxID=1979414 RepID=UPI0039E812D3